MSRTGSPETTPGPRTESTLDSRFAIDARGQLTPADGQPSPLAGRTGYFRMQTTSPDWIFMVRSPPQGGQPEPRPRVVLAGDCGAFHLGDLIAFLAQTRWTGVLRVNSSSGERSLLLKDGDVRSAASEAPGDRIGEVLMRMGYVDRALLERTVAEAPPARIGKALVERGLIKAHDLYRCLNEQISEIFHAIMLSKDGAFALIDQEIDEKALTYNLSLSMNGLLMDSIRKIDELAQFRKRIPHGRVLVLQTRPSEGGLEPEEDALLAQVDGKRTLIEVGQAARMSEFDATRVVHQLIVRGLVKIVEAAATPSQGEATAPQLRTAAGLAQKPVGLTVGRVVSVFNTIFREVRDEVAARGTLEPFLSSANAALRGNGLSTSPVLSGLLFGEDGMLPAEQLTARYQQLSRAGHLGPEPISSLKQAMSDVMFFLLFQAGELLEAADDEELARRVKDHLASLDAK